MIFSDYNEEQQFGVMLRTYNYGLGGIVPAHDEISLYPEEIAFMEKTDDPSKPYLVRLMRKPGLFGSSHAIST